MTLTHLRPILTSCTNQYIDLLYKSTVWFLYNDKIDFILVKYIKNEIFKKLKHISKHLEPLSEKKRRLALIIHISFNFLLT